jgi:dolichyl-diphosphooligosaccharide--protein glycosyltransferase
MKVVFSIAVIALIALPAGSYWIPNPVQCTYSGQLFCNNSPADSGVSIVNGATIYSRSPFGDWIQTLSWVRQNTPTNSIIISWWDYGYWFAVMGNRTTVVDNATLNSTRIAQVAQLLMSNATQSATMAKQMAYIPGCTPVNSTSCYRPAYVAIFITGSIFPLTSSTGESQSYYVLQVPSSGGFTAGGGDESKKQWFIRIGNFTESKYLECSGTSPNELTSAGQACTSVDDFNLTPYAMTNSLFGQLLPFQLAGYLYSVTSNGQTSIQFATSYTYGSNGAPPIEAFTYPSSYIYGPSSTNLFKLAYVSPSLAAAEAGNSPCPGDSQLQCFNTILLYQVLY